MGLALSRPVDPDDLAATHAVGSAPRVCAAIAVVGAVLGLVVTGGVPAPAAASTALAVGLAFVVRGRRAGERLVGGVGAVANLVWVPAAMATGGMLSMWPVVASALAVWQLATVATVKQVRLVLGLAGLVVLAAAGIAPSNALIGPLVLVWGAVLAGLACSVPHRASGGPARRRTLAAVGASAAAGVLVFLLLPAPQGAAFGNSALARAAAAANGANGSVNRTAAAYASGALDLSARGTLPQDELLRVPADSPSLWRAAVLDVYDGGSWTSSGPTLTWTSSTSGSRWTASAEEGSAGSQRSDRVTPLAEYPALVSAGSPVSVSTGAMLSPTESGVLVWPAGAGYEVTSRVTPSVEDFSVEDSPADVGVGQAPADVQRWTALPSSVPARVHDLAVQLTAAAGGDPVAASRAVSGHLRSVARYSLDAPVPGRGQDAVDAFLFEDRIGFCEHFASAEVVLLRSAGFPARLVTGFAGGEVEGDAKVFLAADAHAWVEVWVPGQGWTSSDPTAGAELVDGDRAWWARAWSWLQLRVSFLLDDATSRVVAAAVVAGLAVVVWLVVRVMRRRRPGAVAGESPRVPPAVLRELLAAVEGFERALPPELVRGPAEGLSAWRARLVGRVPAPVLPALEVVERACFSRRVPGRGELDGARGALDSASSALLAARRESAAAGRR